MSGIIERVLGRRESCDTKSKSRGGEAEDENVTSPASPAKTELRELLTLSPALLQHPARRTIGAVPQFPITSPTAETMGSKSSGVGAEGKQGNHKVKSLRASAPRPSLPSEYDTRSPLAYFRRFQVLTLAKLLGMSIGLLVAVFTYLS